jgi:membrane protein required for colicin V production
LNWLDYILIAILFFSVVWSARKGFSREIIGLVTAFAAIVIGMWFYGLAGSFLMPYMSSTRAANLIGFLLVVLAVLVFGSIVGRIVNRFLRTIGLSFFDRVLGAGFGLVRGLLVATAVLTGFMAFGPQVETGRASSGVVHSRIAPYILRASSLFVAVAPMELKASFRKQYAQLKSTLQTAGKK